MHFDNTSKADYNLHMIVLQYQATGPAAKNSRCLLGAGACLDAFAAQKTG
jgi:hypothetical protein